MNLTKGTPHIFSGSECMEDNVGMPGNSISKNSNIETKEDCCNICKGWEGCTFFTYKTKEKQCNLKNSDAGREPRNDSISGSVNCCKGNI